MKRPSFLINACELLDLARTAGARKGLFYVLKTSVRRLLRYWERKLFRATMVFSVQGTSYRYFYHLYNQTCETERTVEIPIVWRVVQANRGKRILEVGNVLSHYFPVCHDILDKYEHDTGVMNYDVIDFCPTQKYDLIVSISTLEHVGWDEPKRDPLKVARAIENLRGCLAPGGSLVFTVPHGHNTLLDELLERRQLSLTQCLCLKRLDEDNRWVEVSLQEIVNIKYNSPFPAANAIVVGQIEIP